MCNPTYLLLHVVENVISNESGLKIKLKVSTVDIQIMLSELRISISKVFSSDWITGYQD